MKRLAYILSFLVFFIPLFNYRIDSEIVYTISLFDLGTLNSEASKYIFLLNRILEGNTEIELEGAGFGYAFLLLWLLPIFSFIGMISAFSKYRKFDNLILKWTFIGNALIYAGIGASLVAFSLYSNQSFSSIFDKISYGMYVLTGIFAVLVYIRLTEVSVDDDYETESHGGGNHLNLNSLVGHGVQKNVS